MIDSDFSSKLVMDANGLSALKNASKDQSPASIKAVASQFEAMFVNMMLKSMREASMQDGMLDNEQTKTFTGMLDQQLSQNIASKGVGLADILTRQLSKGSVNAQNGGDLPKAVNPAGTEIGGSNLTSRSSALPQDADSVAGNAKPTHGLADNVTQFKNSVSRHAEQVSRETGIPAHFMVGQAALESGWGKHEIKGADGTPSHNLFGIKATAGWKGKVVETQTTEYINGVKQKRIEKFRAYDNYAESFKDFATLMQSNPRYGNVMANLNNVNNYANAIQEAGYATDPNYASKLVSVVKKVAV